MLVVRIQYSVPAPRSAPSPALCGREGTQPAHESYLPEPSIWFLTTSRWERGPLSSIGRLGGAGCVLPTHPPDFSAFQYRLVCFVRSVPTHTQTIVKQTESLAVGASIVPLLKAGAAASALDRPVQHRHYPCVLIADPATHVVQKMEGNGSRGEKDPANAPKERE